ncbi:TRML2 protein, partial [Indicator maculatus]|nr:TRML2 protein [Indicator maculatus]
LIFPGLQGQAPAAEESRREGSTLLLRCPYAAQQRQQLKGWGHLSGGQWKVLVEINSPQSSTTNQITKGRVSVRDNSTSRLLTIIMTNLQAEDSGIYCCSLRSPLHGSRPLPLKIISLNVFKELHRWELDTISVQCKYRALEHRTTPKVWCQRDSSGCHIWLRTNSTWEDSRALEGRALIQDDTEGGILTVTMRKLQAQDAGTYWCALHRDWQPARIMELRLFVSKSKYPLQPAVVPPAASCGIPCSQLCTPCSQLWYPLQPAVYPLQPAVYPLHPAVVPPASSCGTPCIQLCNRQGESSCGKPEDVAQGGSSERMESPKEDSKDLKYATLKFEAQPSPEDALYCNLEPRQAHRRPRDVDVQYAIIGLQ